MGFWTLLILACASIRCQKRQGLRNRPHHLSTSATSSEWNGVCTFVCARDPCSSLCPHQARSFFTTQWMSAPQISTAFLRQFPSISDVRNDERMARAYFTSEHVWSSTDPCRNTLLQQFLAGNASDSKLDSRLNQLLDQYFVGFEYFVGLRHTEYGTGWFSPWLLLCICRG